MLRTQWRKKPGQWARESISRVTSLLGWVNKTLDGMDPTTRDKLYERMGDVMHGVRHDYSPPVREFLRQHGADPITSLEVRREPIQGAITAVLDGITDARTQAGFDKLFHLQLVVNGNIVVEKNAVVGVYPLRPRTGSHPEHMDVDVRGMGIHPQITLSELLDNAREGMGIAKFFEYDAFNNNCQYFVDGLLRCSQLLTPELHSFIMQPVQKLIPHMPSALPSVAKAATTLGALADVAIWGV